jgi:peptidyl-prolyl cis-trans isomerase C
MIRRTLTWAAASVAVASIGCTSGGSGTKGPSAGAAKTGTPVAHVGEDTITSDEVKARLAEQAPYMRARYADPTAKKEFLDNMIKVEVFAQEALKEGLDKTPEVQSQFKRSLVSALVKAKNEEKIEVSDDDLKKYFEDHKPDYVKPEKVRVQHIFIAAAPDAKAKAQKLLAQIKAEEAKEAKDKSKPAPAAAAPLPLLAELARDNSADTLTKPFGGDTRFQSMDELTTKYSPEFAKAAFGLSPEEPQSGLIETPKGIHIARFLGRQPASAQSLDDANFKKQLTERFLAEARSKKLEAYYQELKKAANVSVDEQALAAVEVPNAPGGAGAGHPGLPRPIPPVAPGGAPAGAIPRPAIAPPPAPAHP